MSAGLQAHSAVGFALELIGCEIGPISGLDGGQLRIGVGTSPSTWPPYVTFADAAGYIW